MNALLPQKNCSHGIYFRSDAGVLAPRAGRSLMALMVGFLVLSAIPHINAQTLHSSNGQWNLNANGNWSTTANWNNLDSGTDYPSGQDAFANFSTIDITSNRTITLDVPVTLGELSIGDTTGNNSYTIQGGTLTFDSSGGFSTLTKTDGGNNDTISSAIVLNNELDIVNYDTSNSQGLYLTGVISGGTAGTVTIKFSDYSPSGASGSLNYLYLNNGSNSFQGQLVIDSGLLRYESNPRAAGARGVGNETIAMGEGGIDLRDQDFNYQSDDTEIFMIAGRGPNGLGALRNTAGTAYLSHLVVTDDAVLDSQGTMVLERRLNTAGTAGIAPILDFGGKNLTKIGAGDFIIRGVDVLNANGASLTVNEGEVRFESRGLLSGTGTSSGINLDGLTVNLAYNRNPYDNVDLANGSRTTTDLFGNNIFQTALQGNAVIDARFSVGSYWGESVTGTGALAEQTKETLTFDSMTFNFNNGVFQREGNGEAGRTFDHIFTNVTINLVGGGITPDAIGNGNLFDLNGGSSGYNTTSGTFDHPGVTEFDGVFDNTTGGNAGTGFTVRGSRELRVTGNSTNFNGDILIKLPTYRWVSNSFDVRNGGQAASVFFNMSLAGANGSFNQANSITITRWGSLALLNNSANPVYASVNNDDRINDAGFTNLRNGFLLLETDTAVANHENFGNVVADFGTNMLFLDTRAGGQFDGSFQTFARNNNGVLKIYDTNPTHTWGMGAGDDRIALNDATGLVTSGANAPGTTTQNIVIGLFGGVMPNLATATFSTNTRPLESAQGSLMYSGFGMGLMTYDSGFLRPLTAAEYDTGMNPTAGTNWLVNRYIAPITGVENYFDRNNYAARNVTADTAINSLTISFDATASGQVVGTSTKDYIIIEQGKTLTINSGVINFASFVQSTSANMEGVIRGGFLDMNGGPTLINSSAGWYDTDRDSQNWYDFTAGNSSYMRSHIINTTDLVKTGRDTLYMDTWNKITGNIYISDQGVLDVRHPGALGAGGVGREVQIGGAAALLLEYGTNISGINLRATNTFLGSATVLRAEGASHSTWGGDVILDVADAAGSSDFQSYSITARNNGTLSVYGNIYTDHNANFTDSDAYADPPIVTTSYGEAYTVNLRGQFRDVATGNLGTDPANSAITSIYRTGDSATRLDANHSLRFQMTGHDEGNVNVFQQWDATGRLDLNRGYFRILYDPNAAGNDGTGFLTDGADALIQGNDYYTRLALGADGAGTGTYHTHLMLTQDGQVLNWSNQIYVYNNNRDGTISIGGENDTGTVYIGSQDGAANYTLYFENQGGDRDLRFLQSSGGTTVVNARLYDNGTGVNSSVSIVGPGTVIFNSNAIGASTVERWNFLGGQAIWQANPSSGSLLGNDRFGIAAAQAMFGGGALTYIGDTVADRTENLTGNFRLLNGESGISVIAGAGRTDTLNFGAAAASFFKNQGGTLRFIESGPGTGVITLQATGLTNTGIMSYATYGTSPGAVTDFASNGASGAIDAFSGYVTGTAESDFVSGNTVDVSSDVSFTSAAAPDNLRFNAPVDLTLDGQTMTLGGGAMLITSNNTGASSISGGVLTSGFDADLSGAGTARDLMIHNYGTGSLTIGATITDNGADKVNLVLGGTGTTILTAANTNTGDTYLNNGVLSISSDSNLGAINGSVVNIARVSNGGYYQSANGLAYSANTNASIVFTTANAPTTAAVGTFNSGANYVSSSSLTSGGSGYSTGVWANLDDPSKTTEYSAGVWAILDSGNLHFDGGTLAVTKDVTLDGARTLFLGANGASLDVTAGKTLTINGYITSEVSHVSAANGFTANQLGGADAATSNSNPDIGTLTIQGGGTVVLTGAPDNTIRPNMMNSYGGLTLINDGTLKIAGDGGSASGALGTNRSAIDGTIIGANGTLEFTTTSNAYLYEWLTLGGTGYQGRGSILTTGTARSVLLNGQMTVESNMLINNSNSSTIYLGSSGGALYGTGNIARTGNGEFYIYVNAPDWTGSLLNGSGNVRLYGSTSLQGMTSMSLDRNTYFGYGAGSTTTDEFRDRLNDNLAVSINGYSKMRFEAGAGAFSGIEKIGTATVNSGVFNIEYDLGTITVNGAPQNQGDYAGWHFTDIVRKPGTVVMVRDFDPGTAFSTGATDLQNRALVLVDTAPTMVGSGDGTNGNTPIISGFFGGVRPNYFNTTTGNIWDEDRVTRFLMTSVAGIDPITGAAVNYLRPLSDAPGSTDYKIISDPSTVSASAGSLDLTTVGISADQNVRFVGITDDAIGNGFTSRINTIMTLDSVVETNSVTFAADTTATHVNGAGNEVNLFMTQGGGLKIDSGVLMFASTGAMDMLGNASNYGYNVDLNNYIIGGTLDFNGKEGIIYAGSEWDQYNTSDQLNAYRNTNSGNTSVILRTSIYNTGGNGLTKTGPASVTLEAANYYTGDTSVNYGLLYARHDQALGLSTKMNVTGGGGFILGYNARIMGVDLNIGPMSGNNYALYGEGDGTEWGGNVILDNVDSSGSAGGITRNFVPRIEAASSNTVMHIDGNVYGGDTAVLAGAQATSRVFTTYTGASLSTLDFMGQIRDKSAGAVDLSGGDTLNDALRMEVAATTDTANVHLYQQYDAAGRISIVRGVLRYMGTGNFYSDAAALAQDPNSDLSGFQMGGRSLIDSNVGIGASDVSFFLHNDGTTFNLSSWNVGVDTSDPNNTLGNSNYGFGNTTGDTSLGGENISGTITFGTGTGSIRFTQATTLYNRNLNLYAARGGTVDMKVNFLDGGDLVNSSITKVGAGTVRLLGSSAGDSTVESLKMLGGTLVLTDYDVNASRRVGNGAALTLSGGYLIVDATAGTAQEDFSDLTLNSGGSRLAVRGNATVNINSSITLNPASGVTMAFVENSGGVINITASGLTTTDGDRFGYWAVYGNVLGQITDWAAREGTTGVKAFTAYDVDTFASGNNTEVTTSATLAGPTATNSIKFAAAADLNLGGNTLTVENGGMLVSYAAGGAVNISNGTLTRSGAGDILLHNYGTGITTIGANITNSGAGVVNLVSGGVGTTVLSGNNSYTGDTYINGGTLQISSESQLGNISGSIARLVREYNGYNNGASKTNSALYFVGGGGGSGAAGVYSTNSGQNVTTTTLTNGGSGYTSGVYVNTLSDFSGNAGIWAILDSGNLHIDGGTLATTDDITLDGARTIFIGASGATFDVTAGTSLTLNGYITSDVTDLIPGDDNPIDLTRPLVGGLAIEGGGTLVLTGAPDNTQRNYMYNGYNSLTAINNGTIKIATLASTSINALGTYSGWADSTYIGANGTLLMNVLNGDGYVYDWLTLDGQGYQGGGTFQAFTGNTGSTRAYYLRGQINVLSDAVFNLRNGSNIYLNNGGGETYGSANIIKIGQGDFRFYSNESNFTGSYINASGSVRVYDAGRIMGMASMTLERNSFLGMNDDNTGADETRSRLGDDMPLYTNGYIRMRIEGSAGVFSGIEKLGTANVMAGQLGIEFDMGATLAGGVPVLKGEYVGFHYTEIVRNPGTSVQLRLLDPGTSFADKNFNAAVPSNANGNIAVVQVDVLPTLSGTGDGSNGNAAVAVGFFGGVRPNWFNLAGTGSIFNEDYIANRLVTVDTNSAGDHFLRPLLDSEYKVVGNPDTAQTTSIKLEDQGISADQNLKIVGVTSDTGIGAGELTNRRNSILTLGSVAADCSLPAGANLSVNSLTFASESFVLDARAPNTYSYGGGYGNWTSLIIADGATLKINSGMIIEFNTGFENVGGNVFNPNWNLDIRSSLNGGSTDFNGMEAQFNIGGLWAHYNTSDAINAYRASDGDNNYFYMNSSIVNATGLVKSGGALLYLNAPNYYTGLTTVSYGNLYARHDKALGASPQVQVVGYGNFVLAYGSRITGVDLYVGSLSGIANALQIENNSVWAGNVIIDNVDSGGATAYARSFLPRIFSNTTGLASIDGNIFGGSTAIGSGARTDSRIFSTYTGAWGLLYLNGVVQDNAAGAFTGPIDIYNQSQVLRMEVTANNDESAVQIGQQYNAAGRINIDRGSLYFSGNGDFYTAAAAATVNSAPLNPMIGLQMGGRSLTSDSGLGAANLGFFLLNDGANFNLKSWQVGVDMSDPDNLAGNYVYGYGNTTGNSTLGGVNTFGTVNFGTGDGSITFTNGTTSYTRDLSLFAAAGGTVDLKVNLLDGGNLVTSSITKQGGGQVNLLGSSAGDSTVEGVNVMGGILALAGYDTNLNRRVGNGALLTLAGGTLFMDGSGASFTENFGSLKINQGGNAVAAAGNGTANFGAISIAGSSITRAAAGTIHFQSIAGGIINFSNAAMKNVARIGSYATYGANAANAAFATDWAATDAAGNVIAYTGYSTDSFGAGLQTDVLSAGLTAAATNSIRFNDAAGTITSGTLTLNDGGLLITSNYAGGTPVAAGVGVTTSGSGVDLLIHNFAIGVVNFDGSITGAQNIVFTGTGELAFTSPSSLSSSVVSSTTSGGTYTVTLADTTGLTAGMDVSGVNITAGTKILSVVNGTSITLTRIVTGSGTNDLTYSSTSYTPVNTYTGATNVTGSAVVSFNDVGAFGSTSGFFLNGGRLNYSETGTTSAALTQHITLGGNNGILSVSDAGSTLVIRGAANQISSETNNIITAYGTNNPNAGGLQIVGSGTVQFGDRSGFSNSTTEDLLGVVNNYTGLTILGDGVNALRVDIQGKGNSNAQYAPFGTTQSWADGTIIKNNVTVEFSMVRDSARTGQLRFREWFQIGEKAGDQILFDGSTQRQPTFDGILNIIGDLTFQTQGNRYGDAGSTGNSEFLINSNEGGIMGIGNIIKLGDGNLRFYTPLHEWTGDLDIQDGFVGLQMNSGAIFNPNGKIYFGDGTGVQTSSIQMRIENRYYSNNTIGIDAPNMDLTVNRDIIVRDNIKQLVSIAAGYLPSSATIHFTNEINVGNGSSSYVRFYYEDTSNLDTSLTGHVQQTVFDITGNIIGSNALYLDGNNAGALANGATFTVWMRGDNSGYSGIITIGNDNGTTVNTGRNATLRVGDQAGLSEVTVFGTGGSIGFRNYGTLQLAGNSMTFTKNFLFTGGAGLSTSAGIENASDTAATITFDSGTQTGPSYQDVGVGLRDGVAAGIFGGGAAGLSVVKIGAGDTVFGASTGGGAVADSFSNYTGNTLVQEGTLFAGSNNSFSPNSRFIVSSGATLSPYWGEAGTGFDVTIGSLAGEAGSAVNIDQSTLSIGGDNTTDAVFAGVISGFGSLNKIGGGAQTLSGVNTFSGNLAVVQGALIGTNNSAFGDVGNTISLGGVTFVGTHPLDAKVELLLAGTASDVVNPVSMNSFDGNDEGIVVIGTRETSGSYGFATGGTVSLYQDISTNVFFEADGTSIFKFGDAVYNAGSSAVTNVVKIGSGTVELRAANSYGIVGTAGAAIDGGTVIRHGTISVFDNNALSSTVVELGDTRYDLNSAYLATTSSLITKTTGSFDPVGNGASGAGSGAFLNVNAVVDGVTITAADVGKRILVKNESDHPEYNGVYQVVSVDGSCGQMNLVRVADFDDTTEMLYGSSIAVTNGTTQAGLQFFQASSDVTSVNTATTDPVHWLQDIPNADVSLLAANGGLTIFNDIDINDTNGTGSTILGGTFTSDTTYFFGSVTLQHSTLPGVDNIRELTLISSSNDDLVVPGEKGVVFTGAISESQSGDTLSVNKQGAGTVTFTNDNTYTGKTTVTEGTLALAGAGDVSGTSWIEVNTGATFDFSNTTAGDFTFDGPVSGSGTVVTGFGSLIVGTDGGAGVLRPGMSSDPTNISTAGDGIGLLTVNGNVVLTGDTTGVDRLTLQMGATNGADYNDAANVTYHMGAGDLSAYLNSQGSFYDTQTGGNHDRLVVTDTMTLNSGGHVTFTSSPTDYQPVVGDVFNLIDWSTLTNNGFNLGADGFNHRGGGLVGDLALPDLSLSGLIYDTSLFSTYGIVVVVPEPGRMLLLLFGLTAVFCGRRRRR